MVYVFCLKTALSIIFLMVHFALRPLHNHITDVTGEAVSQMNSHYPGEGDLVSAMLDIISERFPELNRQLQNFLVLSTSTV